MLSSGYRLRRHKDFENVYKGGKTLNTALFRIKTAPNRLQHPRFGVVVPNKAVKGAVARNKKKRQVRSAVHSMLPHVTGEYDIILLGQAALAEATFEQIEQDIRRGLQKINLLNA